MTITAQDFINEFTRLKASTDYNDYSGLSADDTDEGIKIFDDYASGILEQSDQENALLVLKALSPIDWELHDNTDLAFEPIWDALNIAGLSD